MKRRQRAGLPLYPQEVQQDAEVFHLLQQQHNKHPNPAPVSFSALLSSSQPRKLNYNPPLSLFNAMSFTSPVENHANSGFYSNPSNQFKFFSENNNNPGYALPQPPVSPFGSSQSTLFNQKVASQQSLSTPFLEYNSNNFGSQYNLTPMVVGAPYQPFGVAQGLETEPPSNQTPLHSTTHTSSITSGDENMMGASSSANDYDMEPPFSQGNSGLLDAVLVESKTLSEKFKGKQVSAAAASDKGKGLVVDPSTEEEDAMNVDDLSSSQSSIGELFPLVSYV